MIKTVIIIILMLMSILTGYEFKKMQVSIFNLIIYNKSELNIIREYAKTHPKKETIKFIKKKYNLTNYYANEIIKMYF
ncbi:hypothetical protein [Gemella sp. zg-1178]|uniref:hypothetical protein n=1 Tax=Gemella sp. zg-1178 TaxID=2840372 RepID=UPI001C05D2CD|nr:hypothetical protein [Gemella sp. zg-1178]MBU0279386.1 hypothetical protein [Gemella sp. zg-1178]